MPLRLFRAAGLAALLSVLGASCTHHYPAWVEAPAGPLSRRPLGSDERAILDRSGFVISDIGYTSYHAGYAELFKGHEPVYFTADAMLHALHSSFDTILADVETRVLIGELGIFLDETRAGLGRDRSAPATERAEVDLYLAVAKSLLDGKAAPPVAGATAADVASVTRALEAADGPIEVTLFGKADPFDASMCKPRGHYTRSEELKRYFRSFMWLGRMDIRLAAKEQDRWSLRRSAFRGAVLLEQSISPRAEAAWRRIDSTVSVFIGPPDSMSLPGLRRALGALGAPAKSLDGVPDEDVLEALLPEAQQRIRGSMVGPGDNPLAFLLLGQRFVFDSLVFTRTTFAALPAHRMMPSPLDVAAAVFKNPIAKPLLKNELEKYGYESALDAVAKEGETLGPEVWDKNVYHVWLTALRELSPNPERDRDLPAVFKTEAWQRRMLSTQLASWAELRHDTVLYAKQSMSSMDLCEYPDGYVDPYPEAFAALDRLAKLGSASVAALDFGAETSLKDRIVHYFDVYASAVEKLGAMAARERKNEPLTAGDIAFLNGAVSMHLVSAGCTHIEKPEGWYADLYYDRKKILDAEPIVADVHTQPTDESGSMVGRILHVGTGLPRLFTVRIETCKGPQVFRGLVASYFEKITESFQRLTDEDWRKGMHEHLPSDVPWISDVVVRHEQADR
jgi:hypothetical protein